MLILNNQSKESTYMYYFQIKLTVTVGLVKSNQKMKQCWLRNLYCHLCLKGSVLHFWKYSWFFTYWAGHLLGDHFFLIPFKELRGRSFDLQRKRKPWVCTRVMFVSFWVSKSSFFHWPYCWCIFPSLFEGISSFILRAFTWGIFLYVYFYLSRGGGWPAY